VRSLVGGVSCLVALWAFLAASDADAFEAKRTSGGLPVHWEAANVTFEIDPSVAQAVAGGFDAVAEALGAWSGQSGAPTLTVTAGDGKARPGNDGHNVIFFAADGYAEAGNALAITVLSYDEITGAIVDADIVINGNHSFAVVADGTRPDPNARPISNEGTGGDELGNSEDQFDLVHVVAHETGHALGLSDALNPGPLMYLYTMPNDGSLRSPTADDETGIRSLYAGSSSERSAGCSTASIASPSSAPRGVLLVVLALGGWIVRRRAQKSTARTIAGPRYSRT